MAPVNLGWKNEKKYSRRLRFNLEPRQMEMERIEVGMHVEIKRSDGRVHGSIVTEVRHERKMVMVEWFEKGETKGKEIDLAALLEVNPTLKVREPEVPRTTKHHHVEPRHSQLADLNDENDETLDDIELPASWKGSHLKAAENLNRTKNTSSSSILDSTLDSERPSNNNRRRTADPRSLPVPRARVVPQTKKAASRMVSVPSVEKLTPSEPTAPVQVTSAAKGNTVQNIEKLERERENRRLLQEKERERRELDKNMDENTPNYSFYAMIRDFRSTIDFRPLRMSDEVRDNRISVCVRKRPLNNKEIAKKEIEVVTIPNHDHLIIHQPQTKVDLTKYLENMKFRFDYTFDENTSNAMIYKFTAQPLVRTIFEQGNATCFAYGQTGSGKTHTMGGDFTGKSQNCAGGIYALTAADVFKMRSGEYRNINLTVVCCFFEIYGAKVFDLLNGKKILRVLEDANKAVNVCNLKEFVVQNVDDVLGLIRKGTELRTAGSTSANANSSRSHAVFQIVLKRGKNVWGKYSLIDLAGNERGQDTGNSDRQTRMEGAEINKSLLALKECIRAMAMNSSHVPFRSSKLTMVLRDSFMGAKSRTCMVAMISPGLSSCENTINTIRYADRVKGLSAENGSSTPLDDEDLMLPKNDEEDLNLLCRRSGANEREVEQMRLATQNSEAEECVLAKNADLRESLKKTLAALNSMYERSLEPDYDQEKWLREAQATQQKFGREWASFGDSLNKWQSLMAQEAKLHKN